MAKYSQVSNLKQDLCVNNKICKSCGLYLNQLPIFDIKKSSKVFWVGLSAVQFDEDEEKLPLSPSTRSGALIEQIESSYRKQISFYKTNLVKCLPLKDDKIRYPVEKELEKCFPNFEEELNLLKPKLVFLLGKQVANFVAKKYLNIDVSLDDDYQYEYYEFNDTMFIPVHHPSYILVYRRKFMNDYIAGIQSFLEFESTTKIERTLEVCF